MSALDSRVIVITGGSLGIGFEIAKKCAYEGATVIIGARNKDDLNKAISKIKDISAKDHRIYSLDVSQCEEVQSFSTWCLKNFNQINGLVNCAGIYGPIGKTYQVNLDKFNEAIRINFLGTVYMCHAFIPIMGSGGRKKIINFSGGGAASPFPNYSAYATSKVAIARFTENLSIELAEEGFDVNCVAPGFVVTRLHQQTIDAGPELATNAFFENTKRQIEGGGQPVEKAVKLTIFLLSSESDGITGKFISAPWDHWQDKDFQNRLRNDKDFVTLRRIDDKVFFKKG